MKKKEEAEEEVEKPPVRWFLVCSTLEEWEALADSFSKSRTKVEKELYKTLAEDFLPEIPGLLEERVSPISQYQYMYICVWVCVVCMF